MAMAPAMRSGVVFEVEGFGTAAWEGDVAVLPGCKKYSARNRIIASAHC